MDSAGGVVPIWIWIHKDAQPEQIGAVVVHNLIERRCDAGIGELTAGGGNLLLDERGRGNIAANIEGEGWRHVRTQGCSTAKLLGTAAAK